MRIILVPAVLATALLAASCSSDGDSTQSPSSDSAPDDSDDAAPASVADESDDAAPASAPDDDDDAAPDAAPDDGVEVEPAPPEPVQGTGTLTLANGETFEVDMFCTLEPQIAAGSEILFTATSTGDPILDITQFGDEGPVTGIGSVSLIDGSTIEPLWGASTLYESFGGALELTLDGNTIRGTGDFYAGDDPIEGGDPVEGDVVAEC